MSLNFLTAMLAQGAAPATQPNPTGDMLRMFGTMAILIVGLLFITNRSQSKRTKELNNMLASLKPGDKVVTSSGILGTVVGVKDKSVSLRSADTKLEVLKSSITEVTERAGSGDSSAS